MVVACPALTQYHLSNILNSCAQAIAGMASSSAGSAGLVMVHPSTSSGTNSRHLAGTRVA